MSDRIIVMRSDLANPLAMHDNVAMVSKHLLRRAPWGVLLLATGFFFVSSPSFGQKTDVNINLYGRFPMAATASPQNPGNPPLKQTSDPSMGFRFGVRHIFNPIFGLEMNFGYSRATQYFVGNTIQTGVVYSHAKPFTIDYVASVPFSFHGIQPFVLGGGGLISYNISSNVAVPRSGATAIPARPQKVPVFEYGIGADFHPGLLPPFMALRAQYRGLIGHAPDYRLPYLQTKNLINISEPQLGLVFKF